MHGTLDARNSGATIGRHVHASFVAGLSALQYSYPEGIVLCTHQVAHAWKWLVSHMFMLKFPQIAEPDPSMAEAEGDELSSYGTGNSSEERMENTREAVAASEGADTGTLFSAIATFARGQAIVIEKLTLLEKVVGHVEFDMTWVRDDMKAVHEVMERIAGNVCDIRDATAEAERPREQVSVDASPPQAVGGKENVEDFTKAPSASTSHGEQQYGGEGVPNWIAGGNEVGSYIDETQAPLNNSCTNIKRLSPPVVGRSDWGYTRVPSPAATSPPCQQPRLSAERAPMEEESQQIEMSCQSAQLPTPLTGRNMWQDFTAAVRDWPPPAVPAIQREEGWVATKRGRWDLTDYGKGNAAREGASEVEDIGAINLNVLLETHGGAAVTRGGRVAEASLCIAGASKNSGNAMGRGTGRGKRLPEVQPRYHTPVRS